MIITIVHSLHFIFHSSRLFFNLIISAFIFLFLIFSFYCFSQNGVSVNTTGATADNSAILDLSSTSQGMLLPRISTAQRNAITSPATSLLIFNITTNCFESYVNGSWYSVSCPPPCTLPLSPTSGTIVPSTNQIFWKWNTVSGATEYKWSTTNSFSTATATTPSGATSYTQSYSCNTPVILYVWASNGCGNSGSLTLNATTYRCPCGADGNYITYSNNGIIQTYGWVVIGNQTWMCQDLNVGSYTPLDVDVYSGCHTGPGTQSQGQKYCGYMNWGAGRMYNDPTCSWNGIYEWKVMMKNASSCDGSGTWPNDRCSTPVQGICPTGWHIPSNMEWTTLTDYIGGTGEAATKLKEQGTGSGYHWADYCCDPPYAAPTNEYGFSAWGGGFAQDANNPGTSWSCEFLQAPDDVYYWSSTQSDANNSYYRWLHYTHHYMSGGGLNKGSAAYVRCVKD
jgi:uncharacterized protein (TIGR02145 family)